MISFCIITDGKEPDKLETLIDSINALGCESEIIVSGNPHVGTAADLLVPMPTTAKQGRLGALRNAAVYYADGDIIVVIDDDMILEEGFDAAILEYEGEWDVMSCRILNPDGTRYWDWKAHHNGKNWLLDYNSESDYVSLTGGLTILKAHVWEIVKWNDELGFNQSEDVDFTNRLKSAGFKIVMNPKATITHDAPYTQQGVGVRRIYGNPTFHNS